MNEANISAQLRDIKPLMEIPDNSFYMYWGLIAFVLVLVLGLLLWMITYLWKNRKINLAKGYLASLKSIDWTKSKEASYEATQYARLLATNEEKEVLFLALEENLMAYKYKKEVDAIDEETMKLLNEYIEVCNG
ncbi:hypothetical protein MNB_SV-13-54 [hydrothermal vent metagenome]|uniref:DUF4381 domain-containing protein n=1 Tax=hydrothermal vent metagenome TaxID=652676 RepID=A0A1W1D096_9ZZZZ